MLSKNVMNTQGTFVVINCGIKNKCIKSIKIHKVFEHITLCTYPIHFALLKKKQNIKKSAS